MPIIISPVVTLALAAIGGATVVRWLFKEFRRVKRELDNVQAEPAGEPLHHHELPTLRRDPQSGEWRVV
jgi:hypothetical protein